MSLATLVLGALILAALVAIDMGPLVRPTLYIGEQVDFGDRKPSAGSGVEERSNGDYPFDMGHRLREAMRLMLEDQGALGGNGKAVEVDETYVGGKESNKHVGVRKNRGAQGKAAVFSMVQRGAEVRSMHLATVTAATLRPIMLVHIDDKSALYTDDAGMYHKPGQ